MSSDPRYVAGKCNIGEREVAVRKKVLLFFLPILAILTFISFHYCDSIFCWLGMLIVSFLSIVIYLEIRSRFCILFGFFNLYNFDRLGNLNEVHEPGDCQKDRRRVVKIILQSMFASLAYASVIHMLGMNYHF